jgi:hypothetical protein
MHRSPLLPIFISTLLGKIVRSLSVILYFPLSPGYQYTFRSNLAIGEVKTCVVRNVSVLQDIEPLRSILIGNERRHTESTFMDRPSCIKDDTSRSACFMFAAQGYNKLNSGVPTAIFDALFTLLSLNSVSTLTAQNHTRLRKGFWLRHVSRLPLLEQARLVPTAVGEFGEMLAEDIPLDSDGPQLPMLDESYPTAGPVESGTMLHLPDTLIERVEVVSLVRLDLCMGGGWKRAIKLLAGIVPVVDVRESTGEESRKFKLFYNLYGGIGNEDESRDGRGTWYGD